MNNNNDSERLISAAEYREGIENAAESILAEAAENEWTESDVNDEIIITADAHQWHTNYGYPIDVLAHSESDPDHYDWHNYVDEIDESTSYHNVLRALAYVVLRADISEKVHELLTACPECGGVMSHQSASGHHDPGNEQAIWWYHCPRCGETVPDETGER